MRDETEKVDREPCLERMGPKRCHLAEMVLMGVEWLVVQKVETVLANQGTRRLLQYFGAQPPPTWKQVVQVM